MAAKKQPRTKAAGKKAPPQRHQKQKAVARRPTPARKPSASRGPSTVHRKPSVAVRVKPYDVGPLTDWPAYDGPPLGAHVSTAGGVAEAPARAALIALMDSLATELAPRGIRVEVVDAAADGARLDPKEVAARIWSLASPDEEGHVRSFAHAH